MIIPRSAALDIIRPDGTTWKPGEPYGLIDMKDPNALDAKIFDAETGAPIVPSDTVCVREANDAEGWYIAYVIERFEPSVISGKPMPVFKRNAADEDEVERIERKIRIEIVPPAPTREA